MIDSQYENIQTVQFRDPQPREMGGRIRSNMGGIVQYDAPSTPTDNLISQHQYQPNVGSVTTVNVGGSANVNQEVRQFDVSELNGGRSDFLSTAKNNGFAAMGNLTGDTVVNFHGMEVSLSTLEAMGEVVRTQTGYELPGTSSKGQQPPSQVQPQQQPQALTPPQSPAVELFAPEVERQVAQSIGPVPQPMYDAAIAQAVESGLDGVNFNDLAFQSGMTPEQARGTADMILNAFTQQADSIAKASGVEDPTEVWEWAMNERAEQFADAKRQMVMGRSTNAMRQLVSEYFRSVPPTVEALQKAGIVVRNDFSGNPVALIGGTWMTPDAAARAGLI